MKKLKLIALICAVVFFTGCASMKMPHEASFLKAPEPDLLPQTAGALPNTVIILPFEDRRVGEKISYYYQKPLSLLMAERLRVNLIKKSVFKNVVWIDPKMLWEKKFKVDKALLERLGAKTGADAIIWGEINEYDFHPSGPSSARIRIKYMDKSGYIYTINPAAENQVSWEMLALKIPVENFLPRPLGLMVEFGKDELEKEAIKTAIGGFMDYCSVKQTEAIIGRFKAGNAGQPIIAATELEFPAKNARVLPKYSQSFIMTASHVTGMCAGLAATLLLIKNSGYLTEKYAVQDSLIALLGTATGGVFGAMVGNLLDPDNTEKMEKKKVYAYANFSY